MRSTALVFTAFLGLGSTAIHAMPIVTTGLCDDGASTCYTGIQNLDVGGSLYDVTWSDDSYANLSTSGATAAGVSAFVGTGLADDAANAINAAFNSAGNLYPTFDHGGSGWVATWVAASYVDNMVNVYVPFSTLDLVNPYLTSAAANGPYAIFTRAAPTSVPEPAAASLLLIGLVVLGAAMQGLTPGRRASFPA